MDLGEISKNSELNSAIDFRSVLLREFAIRQSKNSRFSLRAFAKALSLSPSSLSALLRSKRRPSPALIQRLGPELGLSESEIATFAKTSGEVFFQSIPDDVYEKIADWYHYPILELTKVKGFQPSAGYVALRLGITVQEAQEAADRLVQVGLLEVTDKYWKDISLLGNATSVNTKVSSASKRKLQRQLLYKGIDSLETIPFELRINNSSTVAINTKDLPVARERIIKFYRKLLADLEETRTPSDVYNLSIAFFPLTKEIES